MKNLLVTGASGKLGQLVIQDLIGKDVKIIATTRKAASLSALTEKGVDVREADFNAPESLVKAFTGADRLLLISTDAIGARIEQHKNAIDAAVKAGVKHIIYTSWPNPDQSLAAVATDHNETEKLIKASGLSYTILRNFLYTDNLLQSTAAAKGMGSFFGTAADGKAAFVTRQDCAHAAAGALLSDDVSNQALDITGPEAITYTELASIVSEVIGQKLPYQDLSASDFKAGLEKSGLPAQWADVYVSFDLAQRAGEMSKVSGAVEKLSGRKPQTVKEFLQANL